MQDDFEDPGNHLAAGAKSTPIFGNLSLTLYLEHMVDSIKIKVSVGKYDYRILTASDLVEVPMQAAGDQLFSRQGGGGSRGASREGGNRPGGSALGGFGPLDDGDDPSALRVKDPNDPSALMQSMLVLPKGGRQAPDNSNRQDVARNADGTVTKVARYHNEEIRTITDPTRPENSNTGRTNGQMEDNAVGMHVQNQTARQGGATKMMFLLPNFAMIQKVWDRKSDVVHWPASCTYKPVSAFVFTCEKFISVTFFVGLRRFFGANVCGGPLCRSKWKCWRFRRRKPSKRRSRRRG